MQHVSAENDGSTGDLLPTCSVQRAACSDYQAGLPDRGFRDLLSAAMSPGNDLPNCQTNLSRAEGNLLLTKAGNLRGASRGQRAACSKWKAGRRACSTG